MNAFLDEDLPESNQSNQKLRNLEQEFQIYEKSYQKSENLKKLEKALLTIKPSSVESERIFSSVGRIVTKFRTRLSDDLPLKKREIFEKNETRFLEKITSQLSFLEFFTRRENDKHYLASIKGRSERGGILVKRKKGKYLHSLLDTPLIKSLHIQEKDP